MQGLVAMSNDGSMDDSKRLSGVCELVWDSGSTEKVRCRIDLVGNRFVCERPLANNDRIFDAYSDEVPAIRNVHITTPAGTLVADSLEAAFVSQRGGGGWNTSATDCSAITGLLGKASPIAFIMNSPMNFICDVTAHEVMYLPSFDTSGRIVLGDNLFLSGSNRSFSVVGECAWSDAEMDRNISVALGAEAQRVVKWRAQYVTIWLNNYNASKRSRPFVDVGSPYKDLKLCAENLASIVMATQSYFSKLSKLESQKADNALRSLLDARSSNSNYMAGLLCIFHFLEWFDTSRTMSANLLVARLGITRDEADALIKLRNDIVHGNAEPRSALLECHTELFRLPHPRSSFSDTKRPAIGVLNYLHSIVAQAFVREIGYIGGVRNYI